MCGRLFIKSDAKSLAEQFSSAETSTGISALEGFEPRYNGAPGQVFPLVARNPETGKNQFIRALWGFVPQWMKDPRGGHRPINAKSETVATNGMFRDAYRTQRALLPVDGFFEWQVNEDAQGKQPYAIAMKSGKPFCLAAIWEVWSNPDTGAPIRTFAIVTCPANELMNEIHHRMPVIVAPEDYDRWIGDEPNPADLLKPFPSELMTMWPIGRKVNSPANNDPGILDPLDGEES